MSTSSNRTAGSLCKLPEPRRVALGCLIGLSLGGSALAQQDPSADARSSGWRSVVDRLAADAVQRRQIPNLLVALSRRGERRYFSYAAAGPGGFAKDTVVEIGSITKTFTGVLYLQAVQEGRMNPDASIQGYLPGGVSIGRYTVADFYGWLSSWSPLAGSDLNRPGFPGDSLV